jgi:hypothetical protein
MDELAALRKLISAADGRATPEPVIGLAIATISPWSGQRRDIIDQPSRLAPPLPDVLISFLQDVRPQLGRPLPPDNGWLSWLRYHGLARPLADLEKVPNWVFDPALTGGWLALPPQGGFLSRGPELIEVDGRLAMLHVLAMQAGADVPVDAVLCLAEWFVGPKAAEWSRLSADQCPVMRFPRQRYRSWYATHTTPRPAADVVPVLLGAPRASDSWTRPAPTAAEIAAQKQAEMLALARKLNAEAWHRPRTRA